MVRIYEKIKESKLPNCKGVRIPIFMKIKVEFLEKKLRNYGDKEIVDLMRFGAPIGLIGEKMGVNLHANHSGAKLYTKDIDNYIEKELEYQAVLGPFNSNLFSSPITISPLNSQVKSDPEEWRIILDLRFPKGNYVNSGIRKDSYLGNDIHLRYPKVDSLVELVKQKGRGCVVFKRDLKRAYRQIPVCPGEYNYIAYEWRGKIYVDTVLLMGLRSTAYICQHLNKRMVRMNGVQSIISMILVGPRFGKKLSKLFKF